jgi:hypothetical protein
MLCGFFHIKSYVWGRRMIVEIAFLFAVVKTVRSVGKLYARSGDVLYGAYISPYTLDINIRLTA